MKASELKPGQKVVLLYGAYYVSEVALVLGTRTTRWGTHAEAVVEHYEEDGTVSYLRKVIDGRSTELGIGWKLA